MTDPFGAEQAHPQGCAFGRHGPLRAEGVVERAVLRAAFPRAASRRRLLKAVGGAAMVAALAEVFPLAAASALAQDKPGPLEKPNLKVGFIPITCASPIIVPRRVVRGWTRRVRVPDRARNQRPVIGSRGDLPVACVAAVADGAGQRGLRGTRGFRAQVREKARAALELVGLGDAAMRHPSELSGGMKQRVGIARALALDPALLLMDGPFSALDALTRGTLQDEVLRLVGDGRQTAFMITHDVGEAILLADRILLMTNGPDARVAEVVVNTLPRPRERREIHRTPGFYPLRNHLVDFLVTRSKALAGTRPDGWTGRNVPLVFPAETASTDTRIDELT